MPFYTGLKRTKASTRRRCAERLMALRDELDRTIPAKTVRNTLLLATWNIREFPDSPKGGERLEESYYYIAEILSRFDLIAVQEVRRDLHGLEKLRDILGAAHYDYIVTDITEGVSGNDERIAFVYDKRKVSFRKVAGELVLPQNQQPGGRQFARTPFMVQFQARWFRFNLCSVHIYYGADSGEKLQRRIDEIDAVAEFLADRQAKEPEHFILLGDFNIVSPDHQTMNALVKHGFTIPVGMQHLKGNVLQTKHYDQIAFKLQNRELELGPSNPNAGIFKFFDTVFRDEDRDIYAAEMGKDWSGPDGPKAYRDWSTYQMSDHVPLWVELEVDFSGEYLKGLLA